MELITCQAMRAGFTGGVLIDYPNSSKAKKSAHTHAVYSALMLYTGCIFVCLLEEHQQQCQRYSQLIHIMFIFIIYCPAGFRD